VMGLGREGARWEGGGVHTPDIYISGQAATSHKQSYMLAIWKHGKCRHAGTSGKRNGPQTSELGVRRQLGRLAINTNSRPSRAKGQGPAVYIPL
jgi:hypothetical protein